MNAGTPASAANQRRDRQAESNAGTSFGASAAELSPSAGCSNAQFADPCASLAELALDGESWYPSTFASSGSESAAVGGARRARCLRVFVMR